MVRRHGELPAMSQCNYSNGILITKPTTGLYTRTAALMSEAAGTLVPPLHLLLLLRNAQILVERRARKPLPVMVFLVGSFSQAQRAQLLAG